MDSVHKKNLRNEKKQDACLEKAAKHKTFLARDPGLGNLRIHEQVILSIVGIVLTETDGVHPLPYSFVDGVIKLFKKKKLEKGIQLEEKDGKLTLQLYVKVDYGVNIPHVIKELQRNISKKIRDLTEMEVRQVNIDIQNIKDEL